MFKEKFDSVTSRSRSSFPSSSVGIFVDSGDLLGAEEALLSSSDLVNISFRNLNGRVVEPQSVCSVLLKNPNSTIPLHSAISKADSSIIASGVGKTSVVGVSTSDDHLSEAHVTFFGNSDVPTVTGHYDRTQPGSNTGTSFRDATNLFNSKLGDVAGSNMPPPLPGVIGEGNTDPLRPLITQNDREPLPGEGRGYGVKQVKKNYIDKLISEFLDNVFNMSNNKKTTLPKIFKTNQDEFSKPRIPDFMDSSTILNTNNRTGTNYTPPLHYGNF